MKMTKSANCLQRTDRQIRLSHCFNAAVLGVAFFVPVLGSAQIADVQNPPVSSQASAEVLDVDALVKNVQERELRLLQTLFGAMSRTMSVYSTDSRRLELVDLSARLKGISEPEVQMKFLKLELSSLVTEFKSLTEDPELSSRTTNLNSDFKKQLSAGMMSFILLSVHVKGLQEASQKLMKATSDQPMKIAQLTVLKELPSSLAMAMTTSSMMFKLFSVVRAGSPKPSASDPQPLADVKPVNKD